MSHNYDNWERLVRAVLLREELIEIALRDSRDPSTTSDGSSRDLCVGSSSSFSDQLVPMDYSDLTMSHTDWKALLPPGENEAVWRSASLSFSLDKRTGKNCFMVRPRGLVIIPATDHDFIPNSRSRSFVICTTLPLVQKLDKFFGHGQLIAEILFLVLCRFSEVAKIKYISNSIEKQRLSPDITDGIQTYIRCSIETQRLSPDTIYGAYLVFKLETLPSLCDEESDKFSLQELREELHFLNLFLEYAVATISLFEDEFADNVTEMQGHKGVLQNIVTTRELNVVDRGKGWKEVEIGNLYVEGKKRGEVIAEWKNTFLNFGLKRRPIVEGIEFRPTYRRSQSFGSFRLKTIKQKQKIVRIYLQTIVLKVEVDSDKEKNKAMKAVSTLAGVEYIYMNMKEMKLTVVGNVGTSQVLSKLKKSWHAELLPADKGKNTTFEVGYTQIFENNRAVFVPHGSTDVIILSSR